MVEGEILAMSANPEPQPEPTAEPTAETTAESSYDQAFTALQKTIEKLRGCTEQEKSQLKQELKQLESMQLKLTQGKIEIVVFGEISTGKSALINALIGERVAEVDVQGGWTKEVWGTAWSGCAYKIPGLDDSEVILVDTPGINEVGGADRAVMAKDAAQRADLILFVVDSDLNETEYAALLNLAAEKKPMILVVNKLDLYTPEQRDRLLEILRTDRAAEMIPAENIVPTKADPREVEYVIEAADGSTRSEWKKPAATTEELKAKILEVFAADGTSLIALNAAMYAADRSDRIATLRVQMRNRRANQVIWSYAGLKSITMALTPWPVVDIIGGSVSDGTMVVALAQVYGLEMSWKHAKELITTIGKAAGWVVLGETISHIGFGLFKGATLGFGTALTAVPQGAAAGYGSYIIGQAAKFYFEHGASWGGESPKSVVRDILDATDKESILSHLKDEIKKKMLINPHADQQS